MSYTSPQGVSSTAHIYAAGLDWERPVGLLVYADGSGEYGLKNPDSSYLMAGSDGLAAVAKKHNMVLVTPLAPGGDCPDGGGTCWYYETSGHTPSEKAEWSYELVRWVQSQYDIDTRRVAFGGYSSGAQWTTEFFGPRHGSQIMTDGVAVAISYGGSPKVTTRFTSDHKRNVAYVWDTGDRDSAYTTTSSYGVRAGYDWYRTNGFDVTQLHVVSGVGHARSGQFGEIMDREITEHVLPASPDP